MPGRCLTGLVLLRVKGPESTPITPNVTLEPAALARAAGDAITTHIAGLSQWNGLATRTPS